MTTPIESIVYESFANTFGTDPTGRILFALFGFGAVVFFYAVLRPPAPVGLTAVGLLILLVFGNMFGGAGIYITLGIAAAIVFAIMLLYGIKRLFPNF